MPARQRIRGFTLIECLVAMSLGLIVTHTALTTWQTSQQSWQALTAQQHLQHNARAALEAIAKQAELTSAGVLMRSADSSAVTVDTSWNPSPLNTSPPTVFATDNARGGDSLQLSHLRSVDASDCQGNQRGTNAWVHNQFQRSTSTVHDFACKDLHAAGSTYQALAEGIEDFQVQLAEVSADAHSLQWRTPSAVTNWQRVVAIEVCLRLASPTVHAAAPTNLRGCAGEALPADGHARRVMRRVMRVQQRGAFHG